jgi:hypothetical protein
MIGLSSWINEAGLHFGGIYVMTKLVAWHQLQREFSWSDMASLSWAQKIDLPAQQMWRFPMKAASKHAGWLSG